jgi:hypothetical protein
MLGIYKQETLLRYWKSALKRTKTPALYETEGTTKELDQKRVTVKFFHPWSRWRWYVAEWDGDDLCFGFVRGHCDEWGYFSLSELAKILVYGCQIERDLYFKPQTVAQAKEND